MMAEERQPRSGSIEQQRSGDDSAERVGLPEDHEPIITGYVDVESEDHYTIRVIRDLILAVVAAFIFTSWVCGVLLGGTGVFVFALVLLPSLVGAFGVIRKSGVF